jgi:hypothetical protein
MCVNLLFASKKTSACRVKVLHNNIGISYRYITLLHHTPTTGTFMRIMRGLYSCQPNNNMKHQQTNIEMLNY